MKSQNISRNRGQQGFLVQDWQPNQQVKQPVFFSVFRRIWQYWLDECRRSRELRIWQTSDRWGNTWWHAYHPATGRRVTRRSQAEILEWIDKRCIDE